MIASDQTFSGMTINLDGSTYVRCRFERCEIVISGLFPITLEEPSFEDCQWSFTGPASITIEFMQAMHRAGAKDLIEKTCAGILSSGDSKPAGPPPEDSSGPAKRKVKGKLSLKPGKKLAAQQNASREDLLME